MLVFLTVNGVLIFKTCSSAPAKAIREAGSALEKVAAAFHRGTITTSLITYATTLTNDLRLQVATLKQSELFSRKEQASTAFGMVPLPDVVVEARVPVEYAYYVDLRGPWKIEVTDRRVQVLAPPLRFNTPAMDVSGMTLEVRKGMFKVGDVQENLRKSLAGLTQAQAAHNLALVRENARRQVGQFVEIWLLHNFTDGRDYSVAVRFADEQPDGALESPVQIKR